MAKILIISAVFPPEPVVSAQISYDLAENLCKQNEVTVLCPKPTRPFGYSFKNEKDIKFNYKVIRLSSFTCPESKIIGRMKESKSFGNRCADYISEHKNDIDIIYANAWPLFSQKTIVKTAKKYKIPCILHIQDIYPESLIKKLPVFAKKIINLIFLSLDKAILSMATHIIGISPAMISYLAASRNISLDKFTLVRNWQNDKAFIEYIPTFSSDNNTFIFMYVGSITPSADVENIIQSYHAAALQNAKLIIAGNGTDKEKCIQNTKKLNNPTIEFIEVSSDKVAETQSKANILLLPLKKGIAETATPSKLTAYLLSAKPIIACVEENSDVAQIIKDSDAGFVIEPENVEMLASLMRKVIGMNKNYFVKMGKKGRKYAMKELSREANLPKIVALIEKFATTHENQRNRTK